MAKLLNSYKIFIIIIIKILIITIIFYLISKIIDFEDILLLFKKFPFRIIITLSALWILWQMVLAYKMIVIFTFHQKKNISFLNLLAINRFIAFTPTTATACAGSSFAISLNSLVALSLETEFVISKSTKMESLLCFLYSFLNS